MEPLHALGRATEEYRRRLVAVRPAQWDEQSVCVGWSVRDVADHVLGGNRFAVALLRGDRADDAFTYALALGFDGDPVELFDASATSQLEAFGAPATLERTVHHPAGDISAATFLGFRLGDLVLHAWDIARSTGGDDTIDPALAEATWLVLEPAMATGAAGGAFGPGPSGALADGASAAARLLDASGRR